MKIALFSRIDNHHCDIFQQQIASLGLDVVHNPTTTDGYDLAISYGGDGTFLGAVRTMGKNLIPIMGVNSGRLGFLAAVPMEQALASVNSFLRGEYSIDTRSLLRLDGVGTALNEFTLQKKSTSMIHLQVSIDGTLAASYWADGLILSTPTGSTAYSMSVGGAILSPDALSLIISPIAPHNLNIRPLVISDSSLIEICVTTRDEQSAVATLDNRQMEALSGQCYRLSVAPNRLQVLKFEHSVFYKALREKLFWGVDLRN